MNTFNVESSVNCKKASDNQIENESVVQKVRYSKRILHLWDCCIEICSDWFKALAAHDPQ